jgi:hypothetical protein
MSLTQTLNVTQYHNVERAQDSSATQPQPRKRQCVTLTRCQCGSWALCALLPWVKSWHSIQPSRKEVSPETRDMKEKEEQTVLKVELAAKDDILYVIKDSKDTGSAHRVVRCGTYDKTAYWGSTPSLQTLSTCLPACTIQSCCQQHT